MELPFEVPELRKGKQVNKKETNKKATKQKEYYSLPVYKKAVDLVRQLQNSTQKAPNYIKIGLIKDEIEKLLRAIYLICEAASTSDKQYKYNSIIEAYQIAKEIKIWNRLLLDLRLISNTGYPIVSSYSEDLNRQLHGWAESVKAVVENS